MRSGDVVLRRLRQSVTSAALPDAARRIRTGIRDLGPLALPPGSSVAVGCSSRGITDYASIVGTVVEALKRSGYLPFCVPAMGSHGSATAVGQLAVLGAAGITEETMGCPVRSSPDVVTLGRLPSGMPVVMDRYAYQADGFVVVNRVRPHTEFHHRVESGITKMIAVGLGKQTGAALYHRYFLRDGYGPTIEAIAELVMDRRPLLFAVAIAEDGRGDTAEIAVLGAHDLLEAEAAMLCRARAMVPKLPFDDIDVLIIDQMGKDICGTGIDTAIVGRLSMPLLGPDPDLPRVKRIVVRDLTAGSCGNADGVGLADFITERLYRKIDTEALYVNALAGSEPEHARIPMVLASDRAAVDAAIATVGPVAAASLRLVRIANTRDLEVMEVSAALVAESRDRDHLVLSAESVEIGFNADGAMTDLRVEDHHVGPAVTSPANRRQRENRR